MIFLNQFIHDYCDSINNWYLANYAYRVTIYKIVDSKYVTDVRNKKTTSVGKVFTATLSDVLTPGQITHLCEYFKSYMERDKFIWKILEGEDIRKYYYLKNYYRTTGTIGRSCMRYKRCQKYLDVYVDNAKMLVSVPKRGSRIAGRAILWPYKDTYLMDRVYAFDNAGVQSFYTYAKENGFYFLKCNSFLSDYCVQFWYSPEDNYEKAETLQIDLKLNKNYEYFPYMDSFRYLNEYRTMLSTKPFDKSFLCSTTNGIV